MRKIERSETAERSEGLFNIITRDGEIPYELETFLEVLDSTFIVLHEDDDFPQITRDTPTLFIGTSKATTIGFEDFLYLKSLDLDAVSRFVGERMDVPVDYTRESLYREGL